ncbi:MAG: TetR/AcrR family transcriptional regulator [Acidimicrobiales bacterium]
MSARSGSASRPVERSAGTRRALVEATVDILRHEGFAAATARAIAARAGCNQGLVFYHFGSVVNLLLAALDEVSAERRERYEKALAGIHRPSEMVDLAARVFTEDLDTGDAALLVEMIAGSVSTPGLGREVMARVEPWNEFAAAALDRVLGGFSQAGLLSPAEIAHAVVALYLGLELLSHLDGDRTPALRLFERARQLAALADLMTVDPPGMSEKQGTSEKQGESQIRGEEEKEEIS